MPLECAERTWENGLPRKEPWGIPEDQILISSAREILSGINVPMATRATVSFRFAYGDRYTEFAMTLGLDVYKRTPFADPCAARFFDSTENVDDICKEEFEVPWRILMKVVWKALSQNPNIRHLSMKDVVPKLSSQVLTKTCFGFLEQLKHLDVIIPASKISTGDIIRYPGDCSMPGYQQYVQALNASLLSSARNLVALSLVG